MTPSPKPPRPQVVVLGAGLSGLTAAYELRKNGIDAVVLEAQMRAGGRVLTLRGFADGMYAEAGAMSFPDTEATVMKYVAEFNLSLQTKHSPNAAQYYFLDGKLLSNKDPNAHWPGLREDEQKLGPDGLFEKYVCPGLAKVGNPATPGWPPPPLRELDSISIAEYIARQGASPAAVRLLGLGLFDEDGEGIKLTSALFALAWLSRLIPFHALYTLPGGNDTLPQAFARRLRPHIQYGCQVTRIERKSDRVRIGCRRFDGSSYWIEADYAVSTIPFPILRDLPIEPKLPAIKQKILNQLLNTSVVRNFIQTKTRFWMKPNFSGATYTDLPVVQSMYNAYDGPGARGILENYTTSKQARKGGSEPSDREIQAALKGMAEVFPGLLDQAEGGVRWDWDADPWARGGYADYQPGQFLELYPHVATPDGRLHYAGDHTSLLPGWMEGAVTSGVRAAGEIEKLLTQKGKSHGN